MQATAQARGETESAPQSELASDRVALMEGVAAAEDVAAREGETAAEAALAALVNDVPAEPAQAGRLRRRLARFRGDSDALREAAGADADVDQELTLMLLREENARLKAERHRPAGVGVMVERLRLVATEEAAGDAADDVWSLLSECLAIREGLDHACNEIHAAISSVQERLAALQLKSLQQAARSAPSRTSDGSSRAIAIGEPGPVRGKASANAG
jgi:hypothetical protein